MGSIQYFFVIMLAYVLCHGLTALVITPVQQEFLSDITIFASLVYLPHGVRVLATWLWGWKAFFPLYAGACLAELFFTPEHIHSLTQEALHLSVAVGAVSALAAFEILRLLGQNLYAGQSQRMSWKAVLSVGALASVINSIGQSIVYSGVILPEHAPSVLVTYAVGDMIGLFVSMVALMMVFRWIRLSNIAG